MQKGGAAFPKKRGGVLGVVPLLEGRAGFLALRLPL
ncbi:hypothetical protein Hneap_0023 [Halothiobacillus neapolitanus c2]|uniref:Uncharacterized protein n=1 Tax=Halothiobacillus neapolitanus (strain ATCC 23641 / DSM 15147 / CIP 104769 / NCIMB 8539 / c2) TaxID=555778 RepID=D0KVW2_HALNC|nr:hypothetical protein Hneap_0023 [Halothiobacillus neapolitanus c2]